MNKIDQRAFKRSFLASLARLIGVGLGAGAGNLMHTLVGGGFSGWGAAFTMAIISFSLMWFAEYERETQ